uniref:Uncharacterized protein n=1 Tax=viral metagenome TaxID=1070528 RepID=A0A6C0BNE0_9ZZZZ
MYASWSLRDHPNFHVSAFSAAQNEWNWGFYPLDQPFTITTTSTPELFPMQINSQQALIVRIQEANLLSEYRTHLVEKCQLTTIDHNCYVPHVTLDYNYTGDVAPVYIEPMHFTVTGLVIEPLTIKTP